MRNKKTAEQLLTEMVEAVNMLSKEVVALKHTNARRYDSLARRVGRLELFKLVCHSTPQQAYIERRLHKLEVLLGITKRIAG